MQKSFSTQSIFKSKISGSIANSSTIKGSESKFKFHEPHYSPLHKVSNEEKQYESQARLWSEKRALRPPKRRSFHSSCIYNNYLYIFGGKDITEGKLSDIMRIDLISENAPTWETMIPSNGVDLEPLAYHTGTLVGSEYFIIGGNNVFLRQSPFIYIYDLEVLVETMFF